MKRTILITFLLLFFFLNIANAIDPRYYSDIYDEADRQYFLEQEKEKRSMKNKKKRETIKRTTDEEYVIPQKCLNDIIKFCRTRTQRKGFKIKSSERCYKRLLLKWRQLSVSCQYALTTYQGSNVKKKRKAEQNDELNAKNNDIDNKAVLSKQNLELTSKEEQKKDIKEEEEKEEEEDYD